MNSKQILIRVREIIEAGWTKNKWSADKDDNYVGSVLSPRACRFCIRGALIKADMEFYPNPTAESVETVNRARKAILKVISGEACWQYDQGIAAWQDMPERTKEEVLVVIDAAIVSVEQQEK